MPVSGPGGTDGKMEEHQAEQTEPAGLPARYSLRTKITLVTVCVIVLAMAAAAVLGLTAHLKTYIGKLNDLAYADALTSVHNKGAFDLYMQGLEAELREPEGPKEFALVVFDCNDLKKVNDSAGHDKGDLYLKAACELICRVFNHSPVFRIGGDEFAAVLQGADFRDREDLVRRFDESSLEIRRQTEVVWDKVDIARGLAVYDPLEDGTVNDVVRRADKLMYEHKWRTKHREFPVD